MFNSYRSTRLLLLSPFGKSAKAYNTAQTRQEINKAEAINFNFNYVKKNAVKSPEMYMSWKTDIQSYIHAH